MAFDGAVPAVWATANRVKVPGSRCPGNILEAAVDAIDSSVASAMSIAMDHRAPDGPACLSH
jgi:hypothetical protein